MDFGLGAAAPPAATAAQHGVEALFWGNWHAIAEALEGADLLILGGGGIFFDYWGFDPRRLLENEAPDLAHPPSSSGHCLKLFR